MANLNSNISSVSFTWRVNFEDYYLTSSKEFGSSLLAIDVGKIMDGLESQDDGFNEQLLKLLCINQAIQKMHVEMNTLQEIKEKLISGLEERQESDKFSEFMESIKAQGSNAHDLEFQHIDAKLSNMMAFMNDFANTFPRDAPPIARPPSSGVGTRNM